MRMKMQSFMLTVRLDLLNWTQRILMQYICNRKGDDYRGKFVCVIHMYYIIVEERVPNEAGPACRYIKNRWIYICRLLSVKDSNVFRIHYTRCVICISNNNNSMKFGLRFCRTSVIMTSSWLLIFNKCLLWNAA